MDANTVKYSIAELWLGKMRQGTPDAKIFLDYFLDELRNFGQTPDDYGVTDLELAGYLVAGAKLRCQANLAKLRLGSVDHRQLADELRADLAHYELQLSEFGITEEQLKGYSQLGFKLEAKATLRSLRSGRPGPVPGFFLEYLRRGLKEFGLTPKDVFTSEGELNRLAHK